MIRTFFILILLYASLSVSAQSADTEQAWKSTDGKIIQAKFVRLETDAVVIERNGKSFTIPFTKLAPESVQLAKSLKEGTPDGATTTKSETPAAVTEDPTIRFRWLQTDPSIADAIVQMLKANDLSTDAFNAKINPQIKGGKITELAACEREIDTIRNFKLETAKHKGMQAIGMEAEATLLPGGLLDLRCNPYWVPNYPKPLGKLSCNSRSLLSSKHWSLYARWGDTRTHTLLLACGGSSNADAKPTTARAAQLAKALGSDGVVIHLDVEWRELAATHFAEL